VARRRHVGVGGDEDHDPAALGERLGGMLGLSRHTTAVKNAGSCSRRRTPPPAASLG
jgi:hypothetical protein